MYAVNGGMKNEKAYFVHDAGHSCRDFHIDVIQNGGLFAG